MIPNWLLLLPLPYICDRDGCVSFCYSLKVDRTQKAYTEKYERWYYKVYRVG